MKLKRLAIEILQAAAILAMLVYAMLLIMVHQAERAADQVENEAFEQIDFTPGGPR